MSILKAYLPNKGGIGGLWNQGTSGMSDLFTGTVSSINKGTDGLANLPKTAQNWGSAIMYGGVVIVGGVLLMIAYSFASGTQSIGDVAKVVEAVK